MLDEILSFNMEFVREESYAPFRATKYPGKKLAILSCMDARLTELLPAALGLKNGDVNIIKNAGALITHPYGSVMRSLLICIYELGIETILVVGHDDCGMQGIQLDSLVDRMLACGISGETLDDVRATIDLDRWLMGFSSIDASVRQTVSAIRSHPLVPSGIKVAGLVMDPATGKVRLPA